MWIETLDNGKFKYVERYIDPYTEKNKKVSVTLTSDSRRAWNEAQRTLNTKIEKVLQTKNSNITIVTFGELREQWYKKYKKTVKNRTSFSMQFPINIISSKIPDDFIIKNIDSIFLQDILDELYYDDNYSLNYMKQIKSALILMFKFAIDKEYIDVSPMIKTKLIAKPKTLEEVENIENKFLELFELQKIIEKERSTIRGERTADIIEFISLTGLRFGECVAIKKDQYDSESVYINGTIDYVSKKSSAAVKTPTKTNKSTRKVDLPDRAIEIIEKVIAENILMSQNESYNDRNFVFTTSSGNPAILSNFNTALNRLSKQCNINKKVTSHILRHTHISLLAELNIPLKAIMDRVGHMDAKTTLNIYTHVTDTTKKEIVTKLNSIKF